MTILFSIFRLFIGSKQQHLLVMFQNNYELRGSGGFLTQLLDVTIGRFRFSPAFRHDYHELKPKEFIPAPPDVQKYLNHKHWHLRDSNLFGDFRASARQVIQNYQSIFPHHEAAGVVAVNFHFLEKLMGIIGAVRVGTKTFDDGNIFTELSTNVSDIDKHDLQALSGRKNILKSLCSAVVRTCVAKFWKWPEIWMLAHKSLETKDLQLFFVDERTQARLLHKGLAQDFSAGNAKDFLAIVENNYLGLKSNRYIRRTVFRDVVFELDRSGKKLSDALVRVKIGWKHAGHYNYPLSGTYQSVAKIHVPLAAQDVHILSAPEQPLFEKTADATVVSVHQILGIQQSSAIEFSYRLPAELFQDGSYRFKFIKQSGVVQEHVHETVRFPDQFRAAVKQNSGNNGHFSALDGVIFTDHSMVDRDYVYVCSAELHRQPSRIFFHEMVGHGIFDVRFNEPVFRDGEKFSVKVTDEKEAVDFAVDKLEFVQDNRHLIIHARDIPSKEDAFYKISLNGIANASGIPLGERKITAVYRSKYFSR